MESCIGTLCTPKVYNRQVMKFYVRTYGCQMNVADSNEMGRHFKARGLVETQDENEASIFLVNTCTVRQHAEDRAFFDFGGPPRCEIYTLSRHDALPTSRSAI